MAQSVAFVPGAVCGSSAPARPSWPCRPSSDPTACPRRPGRPVPPVVLILPQCSRCPALPWFQRVQRAWDGLTRTDSDADPMQWDALRPSTAWAASSSSATASRPCPPSRRRMSAPTAPTAPRRPESTRSTPIGAASRRFSTAWRRSCAGPRSGTRDRRASVKAAHACRCSARAAGPGEQVWNQLFQATSAHPTEPAPQSGKAE